jgi:CRISPR/Cas system-associated protein Csx1
MCNCKGSYHCNKHKRDYKMDKEQIKRFNEEVMNRIHDHAWNMAHCVILPTGLFRFYRVTDIAKA